MKVLLSLIALYGLCQVKSFAMADSEGSKVAPRQSSSSCTCGVRNTTAGGRIVNGTESKINEFPWRVAYYESTFFFGSSLCTASILNANWVLIAAHCIGSGSKRVIVGAHDLRNNKEPTRQEIKVKRAIKHRNYNSRTFENDIAVLELESPITMNYAAMPLCLPYAYRSNLFSSGSSITSGWGNTKYQKNPSDAGQTLKWVELDLIPNADCSKAYPDQIKDTMMCAYTQGKDTCQGDSGSGLEYVAPACNRHFAAGIVSWGDECAKDGKPGVYTRVTSYLDWIKTNTNNAEFCQQSC